MVLEREQKLESRETLQSFKRYKQKIKLNHRKECITIKQKETVVL